MTRLAIAAAVLVLLVLPGFPQAQERRAPLPDLPDGWTFVPDLDGIHNIGTYEDAESGAVVKLEIGASERSAEGQCPDDPRIRVSRGTSVGMPYCLLDVQDARAFEIETIRREYPTYEPGKQEFAALTRGLPRPGERYVAVVFMGDAEAWFFYSYYAERGQRVRILDLLIDRGVRSSVFSR